MATRLERIIETIDKLAGNELWNCGTRVLSGECKARYDALIEAADIIGKQIETEDQSRQRFESWRRMCGNGDLMLRRINGEYAEDIIRWLWEAWQASQTFTEASE